MQCERNPYIENDLKKRAGSYEINRYYRDDYPIRYHWHTHIELVFSPYDSFRVSVDGVAVDVEPNVLYVINNNVVHTLLPGLQTELSRILYLYLDERILGQVGIDSAEHYFETRITDPEIIADLTKIYHEVDNLTYMSHLSILGLACGIYTRLLRYHQLVTTNTVSTKKNRIERISNVLCNVMQYIDEHITEEIDIEELSRMSNLSRCYFCHFFKTNTGYSPTEYINRTKCEHAQRMLRTGNYNVTEAAALFGIENVSYFTKIYRKYCGCLPSDDLTKRTSF